MDKNTVSIVRIEEDKVPQAVQKAVDLVGGIEAIVKPGEKLSVDVTADAVGDWALHCHLIYHMHAGMMRVVSVRERGDSA